MTTLKQTLNRKLETLINHTLDQTVQAARQRGLPVGRRPDTDPTVVLLTTLAEQDIPVTLIDAKTHTAINGPIRLPDGPSGKTLLLWAGERWLQFPFSHIRSVALNGQPTITIESLARPVPPKVGNHPRWSLLIHTLHAFSVRPDGQISIRPAGDNASLAVKKFEFLPGDILPIVRATGKWMDWSQTSQWNEEGGKPIDDYIETIENYQIEFTPDAVTWSSVTNSRDGGATEEDHLWLTIDYFEVVL